MNDRPAQTALIIGASRGLGLGLASAYLQQGWQVIGTVRNTARTGLHDLADDPAVGNQLEIEHIDINEPAQIEALRGRLQGRKIDLLFVNAGVAPEADKTAGETSTEAFGQTLHTNALSPMRVIEGFKSLVPESGTIAVMSSGLGSVSDNHSGGMEVYRASKAALNTLMRSFAARHPDDPRSLLLVTPGWVRTDMGGSNATLSVEESVSGMVETISAQAGTPGLQYLNYRGETVPW